MSVAVLPDADADRVAAVVDRYVDEISGLARALVRIPSETHPPSGDELAAQQHVTGLLETMGLELDVFEPWNVENVTDHPGWWPGLDYTDRPNVVGRARGRGGGRSLILNGHIDVVPAGPRSAWSVGPYDGEIRDGKLYGRGAADMKAGIAAMIMALTCVREAGFTPAGDVILQSVVNEELGGFNGTVACCARGYEADAAIVTEPTGLNVIAATKGGQTYRATIEGHAVHHGWWWKGVSALDKVLVVKDALKSWEELRAREPSPSPLHADRARFPRAALADTIWYLRAGDPDTMATPASAEFEFWVDVLPNEDREALLQRFEAHVLEASQHDAYLREHPPVLERVIRRPFAGAAVDTGHPIIAAITQAHCQAHGCPTEVVGGNAANDSMIFNLYSRTPAVVYGPGTTVTAHAPDEHIDVADIVAATKTLALTIMSFCGY